MGRFISFFIYFHLSNDDIDRLDGKIGLEAGGHGSIKLSHTPNPTVFKEYADRSRVMEGHGDLTNENHAALFKNHVDNHIRSRNMPMGASTQQTSISPEESSRLADDGGPSNEMFGKKFHADHELR